MSIQYNMTAVGKKVKDYRQKNNITIRELSEATDLSRSSILKIEKGTCNPTIDTLWRLSNYMKTDLFDFLVKPNIIANEKIIETVNRVCCDLINFDYSNLANYVSELNLVHWESDQDDNKHLNRQYDINKTKSWLINQNLFHKNDYVSVIRNVQAILAEDAFTLDSNSNFETIDFLLYDLLFSAGSKLFVTEFYMYQYKILIEKFLNHAPLNRDYSTCCISLFLIKNYCTSLIATSKYSSCIEIIDEMQLLQTAGVSLNNTYLFTAYYMISKYHLGELSESFILKYLELISTGRKDNTTRYIRSLLVSNDIQESTWSAI